MRRTFRSYLLGLLVCCSIGVLLCDKAYSQSISPVGGGNGANVTGQVSGYLSVGGAISTAISGAQAYGTSGANNVLQLGAGGTFLASVCPTAIPGMAGCAVGDAVTTGTATGGIISIINTLNAQNGATYAIQGGSTGDGGKTILDTYTGGTQAVTVAAAGSAGFPSGFATNYVTEANPATITTTTSTLCGYAAATGIKLGLGQALWLLSDGTNWQCALSMPVPATQSGAQVPLDNMTWTVAPPDFQQSNVLVSSSSCASWTLGNAGNDTCTAGQADPLGGTGALLLTDSATGGNAFHYLAQTGRGLSGGSNAAYEIWAWFKAGSGMRYPELAMAGGGGNSRFVGFAVPGSCGGSGTIVDGGASGLALVSSQSWIPSANSSWCLADIVVINPFNTTVNIYVGMANALSANGEFYTGNGSTLTIYGPFARQISLPLTGVMGAVNGNPAPAGLLGENPSIACTVANQTATFTNGSVNISLATADLNVGCPINFTTTGSLPTGFTVGTNYFVITDASKVITVSATPTGAAISAGSAGSGTQTAANTFLFTSTQTKTVAALPNLTAGDWSCSGNVIETQSSTSTINILAVGSGFNTLATNASYIAETASFTSAGAEAFATGTADFLFSSAMPLYLTFSGTQAGTDAIQPNFRCRRAR